jgi:hypothetical protein
VRFEYQKWAGITWTGWDKVSRRTGDVKLGPTVETEKHNLLLNKSWDQQSGGTNAASGGYPFEAGDVGSNDTRLWRWTGTLYDVPSAPSEQGSRGAVQSYANGMSQGDCSVSSGSNATGDANKVAYSLFHILEYATQVPVVSMRRMFFASSMDGVSPVSSVSLFRFGMFDIGVNGDITNNNTKATSASLYFENSFDFVAPPMLNGKRGVVNFQLHYPQSVEGLVRAQCRMSMTAQLRSDAYRAFSIWGSVPEAK